MNNAMQIIAVCQEKTHSFQISHFDTKVLTNGGVMMKLHLLIILGDNDSIIIKFYFGELNVLLFKAKFKYTFADKVQSVHNSVILCTKMKRDE